MDVQSQRTRREMISCRYRFFNLLIENILEPRWNIWRFDFFKRNVIGVTLRYNVINGWITCYNINWNICQKKKTIKYIVYIRHKWLEIMVYDFFFFFFLRPIDYKQYLKIGTVFIFKLHARQFVITSSVVLLLTLRRSKSTIIIIPGYLFWKKNKLTSTGHQLPVFGRFYYVKIIITFFFFFLCTFLT